MTKRPRRKDEFLEDYISRLPDDVLIDIISRLTIKEAARTSVLSGRWKNLWTFTTVLNFDGRRKNSYPAAEGDSKFISWVNEVLKLHRGSNLNEFRVHFHMCDSHESEITNWVYTAITKRVQNLELNLWPVFCNDLYTFPQECYNSLKSGSGLSCVKSLRSLRLHDVNISGEILEFFIHNCPLLDQLCINRSKNLVSLKVVGSSIQLKDLDIQSCNSLKEIEISAPNLLSFKYYGQEIKLYIENVPQLVDVSLRVYPYSQPPYFVGSTRSCFPQITSCFPQLKTLELDSCKEVYTEFSLCELPKLIHLKLRVTTPNWESLLGLTCIMKACPFLQKLILQLNGCGRRMGKKRHLLPKYSHEHLKVVVLYGFLGRQFDVELAFYVLENATMLEKLILKPSKSLRNKALGNCVKMLEAKIPQSVEFVVSSLHFEDLNAC